MNITVQFVYATSLLSFYPLLCEMLFYQQALDDVRISKEDQELVFKMVAAVLWLGNISFQVNDNENDIEVVNDEGNNYYSLGITHNDGLLTPCALLL